MFGARVSPADSIDWFNVMSQYLLDGIIIGDIWPLGPEKLFALFVVVALPNDTIPGLLEAQVKSAYAGK